MNNRTLESLKSAYREYFKALSIGSLRTIGRECGVGRSTVKKKGELIANLVGILVGEIPPEPKNNRGAPVKEKFVDPKIFDKIEEIKITYLSAMTSNETAPTSLKSPDGSSRVNWLEVRSSDYQDEYEEGERPVYSGQLETINGVSSLLPLNLQRETSRIIVADSTIEDCNLRDGDLLCCYAERRQGAFVATEILSVNGIAVGTEEMSRDLFDNISICSPKERLSLYAQKNDSVLVKALDWFIPMGKGQRTLITAAPKAGKTELLKNIAKAAVEAQPDVCVLLLLTDQTYESVGEFENIVPASNFIYTTYDDTPEQHVFAANFLLKRAKRLAESGADVLMLVDSLTDLALAYNEMPEINGGKAYNCGLECKTVHFIRKYFGAARCFEKGGSLTMIATAALDDNNAASGILAGELSRVANSEIILSEELASKKIYPAIDIKNSQTKRSELLLSEEEQKIELFVRGQFLPEKGNEALLDKIGQAATSAELYESVAFKSEYKIKK